MTINSKLKLALWTLLPRGFEERTLGETRRLLLDGMLNGGGSCLACGRRVQAYRRRINSTMAWSLGWLVDRWRQTHGASGYVDVPQEGPKEVVRTNQLTTCKWWGLIESPPGVAGFWRPTKLGLEFVDGSARIYESVWTYNDKVVGFTGDLIDFDGVDTGFTLDDAMAPMSPAERDQLEG